MAPIPIAKRVASYKVKNPQKVKISKLKEYASIAQKRLSDKFYDDQYKAKERDRKRRQRALKKKEISKPVGMDTSPPLFPLSSSSYGVSALPLVDSSGGSNSEDRSDVQLSFTSTNQNTESDDEFSSMTPQFSSTPAPKLKVRIPFKDRSNLNNKDVSRQAKQGLVMRKRNNQERNEEICELKTLLDKSEDENIEKDFQMAEMNKKMRELQTENSNLMDKLKTADDWLGLTYKYMTPAGRSELRNGAYLAKEHFPVGTVRRIRENTGINLSKSPNLANEESSALQKTVQEFAFENSSEVPDMKAAKKGLRYFYCYKTVLWVQFQSSSGVDISYSQFCRYWPDTIIKPKIEDYGSCKCIPCENAELLLSAMKRQGFLPKEHQLEFMIKDMRAGDATLEEKFKEDLNSLAESDQKSKTVTYLHWENVQKENGKRDVVHRVQKVKSCVESVSLMKKLYEVLQKHLQRNYVIKKTLKERKETVMATTDQAYLHMDWAENLEIKIPGEVQSAFFSHTSISLHTGYLYSKEDSGGFVSLSDDGCHKAEAIHTAIKPVIEKLIERGIKHLVCVSDSPTSQYRNNKNMWLTKQLAIQHKITIEWLFTEAGHGKSCCDGIGGTLKNLLRDLTSFNTSLAISSAKDVLDLITPHTSIDLFWFEKADIDAVQNSLPALGPFTGATKIHQVLFDCDGNMQAKALPTDPISQKINLKVLRKKNPG